MYRDLRNLTSSHIFYVWFLVAIHSVVRERVRWFFVLFCFAFLISLSISYSFVIPVYMSVLVVPHLIFFEFLAHLFARCLSFSVLYLRRWSNKYFRFKVFNRKIYQVKTDNWNYCCRANWVENWITNKQREMFRRYSLLDSSPPSASVSIIPHRPRRRRHQSTTHEIASSAPVLTKPPSPKQVLKPANSLVFLTNKISTSTSASWYTRWGSSLRKNLLRRGLSVSTF